MYVNVHIRYSEVVLHHFHQSLLLLQFDLLLIVYMSKYVCM